MKDLKNYPKEFTLTMLKALLNEPIISNLRKVQVDELTTLFNLKRQLYKQESDYIKMLYQNFILNQFRFDDKIKTIQKANIVTEAQHIGMRMYLGLPKQ